LAEEPTWRGLIRGMLVLAALWWAWGGYVWLATTTMLEEGGTRSAYALASKGQPALLRNVLLLLPGATASTALLIAASFQDGWTPVWMWAIALLLDYAGPLFIDSEGWTVSPEHFPERFGLIFIIALGESLIALGVGASELPIDVTFAVLCAAGVLTVSAMWWLYFDVVSIVAARRIGAAEGAERNTIARDSYSYLHLPMVAGVILYALGIKKALAHPEEQLTPVVATALAGGIADHARAGRL